MKKSPELYACLYVREFPAQSLLRLRPNLQDKPCIVMEGEPPLQIVCSLNTRARLLGICHGMTRVEVETFQSTIVLSRSTPAEDATKNILLECAGAYSPRIEERSGKNMFLCGLDIAGTERLFGPPEKLANSLMQRVRAIGLSSRVTVSANFFTAACLAKALSNRQALQVIPAGNESHALSALPINVLDVSDAHVETLAQWGIHTLGMLAALPENELIARLGQDGRRLRQLAAGTCPHLFQPVDLPFSLEERAELDHPLEELESLLFTLSVMLDQLIFRAQAKVFALASVTITLELLGGASHCRTISPRVPCNDKQFWLKLIHLDLEAHPPRAAILTVLLHAEPGEISKIQLGLFSPQLPEPGRLDVTLARIAALVGEGNVGQAVLDDTHRLDAFHMEPFKLLSSDSTQRISAQSKTCIRRLRPPERVTMDMLKGAPSRLLFRGCRYIVEHAYGPWLIGGDWWAGTIWGDEQWDLVARSQDGSLLFCCVAHDLIQNLWQMAGLYD